MTVNETGLKLTTRPLRHSGDCMHKTLLQHHKQWLELETGLKLTTNSLSHSCTSYRVQDPNRGTMVHQDCILHQHHRVYLLLLKCRLEKANATSRKANATSYHANATRNQDSHTNAIQRQNDITEFLIKQQLLSLLPTRDIPVLDGEPLLYRSFIKAFQHGIECKTDTMQDRLYYLAQYKSGQPRTCS